MSDLSGGFVCRVLLEIRVLAKPGVFGLVLALARVLLCLRGMNAPDRQTHTQRLTCKIV